MHDRTHTGDKLYQKGTLVRHQRIHTGDEPYQCSICGKCFTVKVNLEQH